MTNQLKDTNSSNKIGLFELEFEPVNNKNYSYSVDIIAHNRQEAIEFGKKLLEEDYFFKQIKFKEEVGITFCNFSEIPFDIGRHRRFHHRDKFIDAHKTINEFFENFDEVEELKLQLADYIARLHKVDHETT